MKLFEISNRGLVLIALLVAVLWTVIFAERALLTRAERDFQEFRRLHPVGPVEQYPADPVVPPKPSPAGHSLLYG